MFDADTKATIPGWNARKLEQWERISSTQPGLQLVRHGEGLSTFTLVCSRDGFYDTVIIGQLPSIQMHRVREKADGGIVRALRPVVDRLKSPDKRTIDLSDVQIDAILAQWAKGKRAKTA